MDECERHANNAGIFCSKIAPLKLRPDVEAESISRRRSQGPTDTNSDLSRLIVHDFMACAWTTRCDWSATKSLEQKTPHHSARQVTNEKELVILLITRSRQEIGYLSPPTE
jgi:hypothetical protein